MSARVSAGTRLGWAGRRAVFVSVLLSYTTLLFLAASRQGLWFDETYTAAVIGERGSRFWSEIATNDRSFAPYYVMAKAWSLLVGTSEVSLRSMSVLAQVGATALLWWLLRKRLGAAGATVGAIVLGSGLLLLQQAVTARPYGLITLGCVGLLALATSTMETQQLGRWTAFCTLAGALPWVTPLAGLGPGVAMLGPVAWSMRRHRTASVAGVVAVGVAWLANILTVLGAPGDPHKFPGISIGWLIETAVLASGGRWLSLLVGALAAAATTILIRRRFEPDVASGAHVAILGLLLAATPAVLTLALGLARWQVYSRYVVGSAVGLAVLCAWVTTRIRNRRERVVLVVAVLAVVQFFSVFWPLPSGHQDDWRVGAAVVDRVIRPGDGLITPSPLLRIPLGWYGRERPDGAFGRMIWPARPLGSSEPAADYLSLPFSRRDTLPLSLPDTVWLLVYTNESSGADAAAQALVSRGYRNVETRPLWAGARAPDLVLERFALARAGPVSKG